MAEALDHLEQGAPSRRQLLVGTRVLLAVAAVSIGVCGWNIYRDVTRNRVPRARRRKWKWGTLATIWLSLAWWSERRQRSSSIS